MAPMPRPPRSPSAPPSRFAIIRATAGAYLFGVLGTLFYGLLSIPVGLLDRSGRGWFWLARAWSRQLLWCSGMRILQEREEALDPETRYVFLANHASFFDIPLLFATLPLNARFAARHGLFRIPVLGWAMRAGGFIEINRDNRGQARDAFQRAGAQLSGGTSVLFFPEGTRCHDGNLGPFERGGFLLALRSRMPIVPVGIAGTYRALPRGRRQIWPSTLRVRYGEPVDVASYGVRERRRLVEDVTRRIAGLAGIVTPSGPGTRPGEGPLVSRQPSPLGDARAETERG